MIIRVHLKCFCSPVLDSETKEEDPRKHHRRRRNLSYQ